MTITGAMTGAWEVAVAAFMMFEQSEELAESTVKLRRFQLRTVARRLGVSDPWAVRGEQLREWVRAQRWKADTRRSYRTTLRAFYAWGVRAGLIEVSPALAIARIRPAQPNPSPTPDQIYRVAIAGASARERLMLRLAAVQGLRACEIAVVHSSDLVADLDGWSLTVHGKGQRERLVPLAEEVATALRSLPEGWAFPGRIDGHLSRQYVSKLLGRALVGPSTGHKLRHRAGTRVYRTSGHDIRLTAAFLGHGDTKTTMVYVAPDTARMRAAVREAA